MDLNKVMLIGHVGQTPQVKAFSNGGKICNFSIATSEKWTDKKTGDPVSKTYWHRIAVNTENLINICERFLTKGTKVYVEGQHCERSYKDKDGVDKYVSEIVVSSFNGKILILDFNNSDEGKKENTDSFASQNNSSFTENYIIDDEIPF